MQMKTRDIISQIYGGQYRVYLSIRTNLATGYNLTPS